MALHRTRLAAPACLFVGALLLAGAACALPAEVPGVDVGMRLDPLPALRASRVDGPNPATLALDAAEARGAHLGAHDEDGFTMEAGPVQLPILWVPGLEDEHAVHAGYLLVFSQTSDDVVAQVTDALDDARANPALRGVPQVTPPDLLPHAMVDVDAPGVGVAAHVDFGAVIHPTAALGPGLAALPAGRVAWQPPRDASAAGLADPADPRGDWLFPPSKTPLADRASPQEEGPRAQAATIEGASSPLLGAGLLVTGLLLAGAALYHLVDRRNIFESDVRARVYDFVAKNPGAGIHEVAKTARLSHPTTRYHLELLVKNGLLVSLDRGNRLLYFLNRGDFTPTERELVALLRTSEALRAYEVIASRPWITRRELSSILEISRTSVNWHLRTLTQAGLIEESREQGVGFLFASREGREAVERVSRRVAGLHAPALPDMAPVSARAVASEAPVSSGIQTS